MTATAKVTVRLEINSNDSWGDGCTVGQIKSQAKSAIKNELQRLAGQSKYRIKMVDEPTVTVVTFEAL